MAHANTPADFSSSNDINMPMVWITGILGTMVVAIIVLFSLAAFQFVMQKEHERKVLDKPNAVDTVIAEQVAPIASTLGAAMAQTAAAYAAEAPVPAQLPEHDAHHGHAH